MPKRTFIALLFTVILAAGVTVWTASRLARLPIAPGAGWAIALPVMLAGYVLWRVISARSRRGPDDP